MSFDPPSAAAEPDPALARLFDVRRLALTDLVAERTPWLRVRYAL